MAQRLQQKRSSIAGRRPDASYLEPGELAVNTNAGDPGLYFEGNDGSIVKAGPTAVSVSEPASVVGYGNGENWFETGNKELNVWSASKNEWEKVLSPSYGGAEQLIYVGTEFPEATDDLSNDGRSRPFASFNRACMEVARRSILQGRSDEPKQGKFTIVLLPGTNIARNEPGIGMETFNDEVGSFVENQEMTVDLLRKFNPTEGGIVLPRGCSVVGMDPHKCEVHPTFYPRWSREEYENLEPLGSMVPRSCIFYASGDSLINRLSFGDKIKDLSVVNIEGEQGEVAILHTLEPHGVRSLILDGSGTKVLDGDFAYLNYPPLVPRSNEGIKSVEESFYWLEPITDKTLRIRRVIDLSAILRRELPSSYSPGSNPNDFLSLTISLKTHHRLTAIQFASESILTEYYTKIQYAFSDLNFGGAIDDSEVIGSEVNLGISMPDVADPSVDDVTHRVPTVREVSILSNYGMSGLTADGSLVKGMKQMNCFDLRYKSFQNDPDVYEVFYDGFWISLKEATARGSGININEVTDVTALQYLIDKVSLENVRFFFRSIVDVGSKSSGLTHDESETRHYALLAKKDGVIEGINQAVKGGAVAFWAKEGGQLDLENINFRLGMESIRSEGFSGVGTMGGALEAQKGYEVIGIRRPSLVSALELGREANHKVIHFNTTIRSTTNTTIRFYNPINTTALLPYSLRPGSVIWVSDITDGSLHKATISSDGLSKDGLTLNVESSGNTIQGATVENLSVPYIRRFVDPRNYSQRSYYLHVRNTSQSHNPPTSGLVLRYAENQDNKVTQLLEPGRQLDPGENGGWNHLFVVHQSQSFENGNNPNVNPNWNATPDRSSSYYVSLKLSDSFGPWISSEDSARGTSATYESRNFVAEHTDITDTPSMVPTEAKSEWTLSKRGENAQPVGEAYVSDQYVGGVDPLAKYYTESDTYLRGVKCADELYDEPSVVDYDDGTSDFGLKDADNPNVVDQSLIDPNYTHSKTAISRFLAILGYSDDQLKDILGPQFWNDRDLPVEQFAPFDCKGYGLSVGHWPVEFNQPSTVLATGVVWEHPGSLNNSKGLNQYRKSTLNRAMRFDSMNHTVWGGRSSVQGQNQLGETLPLGTDPSRRTDEIF